MGALGIDYRFLIIQAVGFLVLVFILKRFAFGPILGMLQRRQDHIRENLDEAEARRREMIELQHEYEERLAKIEEEARDKIQVAVREAQAARDEIVARARTEGQTLVQRAQEEIARERDKAMVEIRDEIAGLAVQSAHKILAQNLDEAGHRQLINEVIDSLGQRNGQAAGTPPGGGAA